jgi:hypothetical protein
MSHLDVLRRQVAELTARMDRLEAAAGVSDAEQAPLLDVADEPDAVIEAPSAAQLFANDPESTTQAALQEQASGLGLPTWGSKQDIYERIIAAQ